MLCYMIDCSRNAVMNVKSVKKMVDLLKLMGYDTLMLYTEETYEIENHPFFGHNRGRYSKEELKEIDAYCVSKGIELIPCIQTLAHLDCMVKWKNVYNDITDTDNILLIDEEKTYELIRDMFTTVAECFTSRKIHLGMDEAMHVGSGKYMKKHGYVERFELINRHLHRVCKIADQFGFKPMIWSDMFCTLALNVSDHYDAGNVEDIKKQAALPENISLVYWNYKWRDYDKYVEMLTRVQAFDRKVLFAGGAKNWRGFIPYYEQSIATMGTAIKACATCGVQDIIVTTWGDDGGECSTFATIPAAFHIAQMAQGNYDEENIKKQFKELFGMDYDVFVSLEKLNTPDHGHIRDNNGPASKYLLYSDPFMGIFDYSICGFENQYYTKILQELNLAPVSSEYAPIFDYARALCDVLTVKSELGVRTRNAYKNNEKETLRRLAESDYNEAIKKVAVFHELYYKWWMTINKPQGFEVQDIRFGGLIQRLKTCRDRLIAYCDGDLECILELEEEVLADNTSTTFWGRLVTAGLITHRL